eukprot:m.210371 g.210371  ORF g.210371 m.210371 type:complete len:701 (-) comp33074_c1_seq1:277-2379(-)
MAWVWEEEDHGFGDDFGNNDDDESENVKTVPGKDSVIFLVDCTKPMLESYDADSTFLQKSLQAIISTLYAKLIKQTSDPVGIVLFGTRESKHSGNDFDHVYVLRDLEVPDVALVQTLEKYEKNQTQFEKQIGWGETAAIGNAFWACNQIFTNCRTTLADRRIIMITNVDNPLTTDDKARRFAITKAMDVSDKGIGIDIIPIRTPAKTFDATLFYKQLTENYHLSDTKDGEDFESMLSSVRSRVNRERPLMVVPFTLHEGLDLGVRIYRICRIATKGTPKKLDKKDNTFIESKTRYTCAETDQNLRFEDIKKGYVIGGETVIFDKLEYAEMKFFDTPGLVLMGFKPLDRLKQQYNVNDSCLVYPDETIVQGSISIFLALHTSCKKFGKVAICRLIGKRGAAPKFVALKPTQQGFIMIYLPYANDMRKIPYDKGAPKADEEQVELVKPVIKALLSTEFSSQRIPNPGLALHYRTIEALAFHRDSVENVQDGTMVDDNEVARQAEKPIKALVDGIYPDDYDPSVQIPKRKAPGASGAAKKAKVESDDSIESVQEMINTGKLTMTVPRLKLFLKSQGCKAVGKKAELEDLVHEFFETYTPPVKAEADADGAVKTEISTQDVKQEINTQMEDDETDVESSRLEHTKNGGVFWRCERSGDTTSTTWGSIGEEGTESIKTHKSAVHAKKFYDKKLSEKLAGGYDQAL